MGLLVGLVGLMLSAAVKPLLPVRCGIRWGDTLVLFLPPAQPRHVPCARDWGHSLEPPSLFPLPLMLQSSCCERLGEVMLEEGPPHHLQKAFPPISPGLGQ